MISQIYKLDFQVLTKSVKTLNPLCIPRGYYNTMPFQAFQGNYCIVSKKVLT